MRLTSYLRAAFPALVMLFILSPVLSQPGQQILAQADGSKVAAGSLDESLALNAFRYYEFAFWDDGTPGYDINDPVYLHFNPNYRIVSEGDIRLTPFGNYAASTKVLRTDIDNDKKLTRFANAEPRYLEHDGIDGYSLGDPIYLTIRPGIVSANDVRLASYLGYAAGSKVTDADADQGMPTSTVPGGLSFYNADGNIDNMGQGIYGTQDNIYLDVPPSNVATVNDVRLSI
jgi:hypothetical protein